MQVFLMAAKKAHKTFLALSAQMMQRDRRLTFFFSISLLADGPHSILPKFVVTKDLPISPRFTPYDFLSRCKFSTRTTRQPMVEVYLLTFITLSATYGRKKEHKIMVKRIELTTSALLAGRCAGNQPTTRPLGLLRIILVVTSSQSLFYARPWDVLNSYRSVQK